MLFTPRSKKKHKKRLLGTSRFNRDNRAPSVVHQAHVVAILMSVGGWQDKASCSRRATVIQNVTDWNSRANNFDLIRGHWKNYSVAIRSAPKKKSRPFRELARMRSPPMTPRGSAGKKNQNQGIRRSTHKKKKPHEAVAKEQVDKQPNGTSGFHREDDNYLPRSPRVISVTTASPTGTDRPEHRFRNIDTSS